jgi:transposase
MNCKRIGLDLAKNVFQLHGVDNNDQVVLTRKLKRTDMKFFFAQLPPCEVAMESCATSHYWARCLQSYGHQVKLLAAQHVKPYLQGGKNDANDAAAICEAASRPHMKYVGVKNETQQTIQLVHRTRTVAIRARTALANEIRSTLAEFGILCDRSGIHITRQTLMQAIHDSNNIWPEPLRSLWQLQAKRLDDLNEQIEQLDNMLKQHALTETKVKQLMQVEGVGLITASAIACAVPDISQFKNGREFAAWLGLTPRQNSSGGKTRLGHITKRGDTYLRYLLVHGARTVVQHCKNKLDYRSLWIQSLLLRRPSNVVVVAMANKTARIIWAMLSAGADYRKPSLVGIEAS